MLCIGVRLACAVETHFSAAETHLGASEAQTVCPNPRFTQAQVSKQDAFQHLVFAQPVGADESPLWQVQHQNLDLFYLLRVWDKSSRRYQSRVILDSPLGSAGKEWLWLARWKINAAVPVNGSNGSNGSSGSKASKASAKAPLWICAYSRYQPRPDHRWQINPIAVPDDTPLKSSLNTLFLAQKRWGKGAGGGFTGGEHGKKPVRSKNRRGFVKKRDQALVFLQQAQQSLNASQWQQAPELAAYLTRLSAQGLVVRYRFAEANGLLTELYEQGVDNHYWQAHLKGQILLRQGAFSGAIAELNQALEELQKQPDNNSSRGEVVNQLAEAAIHLKQYQQADEYLKQAEQLAQGDWQLKGRVLDNRAYYFLNQSKEAALTFEPSADPSPTPASGTTNRPDKRQLLLLKALEAELSGLHYSRLAKDTPQLIITNNNVASVYERLGQLHYALKYYLAALNWVQSDDEAGWLSFLYKNLGVTYQQTGEQQKAQSYLRQAIAFSQDSEPKEAAQMQCLLAYSLFELQNYPAALKHNELCLAQALELEQASELEQALESEPDPALKALQQRAYLQLSEWALSQSDLNDEMPNNPQSSKEGVSTEPVGAVYQREQLQKAQRYLDQIELTKLNQPELRSRYALQQARLALRVEANQQPTSPDIAFRASSAYGYGANSEYRLTAESKQKAQNSIEWALQEAKQARFKQTLVTTLQQAMLLMSQMGQTQQALDYGQQATAAIFAMHQQLEAQRLGPAWSHKTYQVFSHMAQLYLQQPQAIPSTEDSEAQAAKPPTAVGQALNVLERGRAISLRQQINSISLRQQLKSISLRQQLNSINLPQQLSNNSSSQPLATAKQETSTDFNQDLNTPKQPSSYHLEELAQLSAAATQRINAAVNTRADGDVKTGTKGSNRDLQSLSMETDATGASYYHQQDLLIYQQLLDSQPRVIPKALTIAQAQQKLKPQQGVLYFFTSEHEVHLFYIDATQIKHLPLGERKEVIAAFTAHMQQIRQPGALDPDVARLLPQDWRLPEVQELLVVAGSQLNAVAFASINIAPPSQRYRPLVSRYRLVHTPSLSSYFAGSVGNMGSKESTESSVNDALQDADSVNALHDQTKSKGSASDSAPILTVFADPLFKMNNAKPQASVMAYVNPGLRRWSQQLKPLPWTRHEAIALGKMFPQQQVQLYLQEQASRANLHGANSRNAAILHLATHGYFQGEDGDQVGFALSRINELGQADPGFVTLSELASIPFNNQLVVISGCDTAMGMQRHGEGMLGVARGFLVQGVPQVVATLWPVSDRASALFMQSFYQHLKQSQQPATALAAAQNQLRRHPRYRHPFYWGAYVLTSVTTQDQLQLGQ